MNDLPWLISWRILFHGQSDESMFFFHWKAILWINATDNPTRAFPFWLDRGTRSSDVGTTLEAGLLLWLEFWQQMANEKSMSQHEPRQKTWTCTVIYNCFDWHVVNSVSCNPKFTVRIIISHCNVLNSVAGSALKCESQSLQIIGARWRRVSIRSMSRGLNRVWIQTRLCPPQLCLLVYKPL